MRLPHFASVIALGVTLSGLPAFAEEHGAPSSAPAAFDEAAFSSAKSAEAAAAEAPLEQAQLAIESTPTGKMKLRITNPAPLASDEVYVLESSQNLKNWAPYRIYVSTTELVVPKRFDKEFFRVVKRKLPKGTATGSILVDNYVPAHWETRSDGTRVWVPERGSFFVRGTYSVPSNEVSVFPSPAAFYPPVYPDPKYASLESGIVGSNAGNLIYSGKTSYPFQSPQKYTTRAEAQAYLNNVKVFVVPRFVQAP